MPDCELHVLEGCTHSVLMEATGTLELTSNVKNVQVTLDGEVVGLTPLRRELKPGKHELKLEKKAYLTVERLVTVEAKQVSREEIRLILKPGERPEEELLPAIASSQAAARTEGSVGVPTAAWISGGVAVAAFGAGAVLGLTSKGLERELLDGYDPDRDLYAGTRADALAAEQTALLANACLGVGAAALVTGALLTVFTGDDLEVTPAATPGGGGLSVRGRF